MKPLLKSIGLLLFLLLIFSSQSAATYYDPNGIEVEKAQYEKVVQMRAAIINKINKEGYGEPSSRLEDPVLLRNKRIEQWKALQNRKKSAGRATKNPTGSDRK